MPLGPCAPGCAAAPGTPEAVVNWSAGAEILNRRSRLLGYRVNALSGETKGTPQFSYLTVAVISKIVEPSVAWEMPWGMAAACCWGVC